MKNFLYLIQTIQIDTAQYKGLEFINPIRLHDEKRVPNYNRHHKRVMEVPKARTKC